MAARIKAISYYLPSFSLDNDQLSKMFPEWSVDKISEKTGIKNRHIAAEDEYSSDMGVKAALSLFEEYSINPSYIDFILFCTQSPDYFLPTTACLVQERLGIPTTAGALDFNLGCSGFVYGLALAKGLVESKLAKNVLLITAETYSKFINEKDKSNRTIFGDAAAATLIGADGMCNVLDFEFGTDGKGAGNLIVKEGALRYRNQEGTINKDNFGNITSSSCLYMNGPEIFSFTSSAVPGLIKNVLSKNNMDLDNIDLFIFHQANRYMLNHLRKKIGIPEEKFFYFLENCGNTVSSTIPIALKEALIANRIKKGNKVLLAGFGVGYSWGGVVIEF
ncbi:MAG: ketoacyl-ACP synthase III [Ginsengibacter sp.]